MSSLNKLRTGDIVKVYYQGEKNSFKICEITHGSKTILALNDYKTANQKNQLIGIIVCPICCLLSIGSIFMVSKLM